MPFDTPFSEKWYNGPFGGGGASIPFDNDANTFWWDFDGSKNGVDTVGPDTVCNLQELVQGAHPFKQPLKDKQPRVVSGGATFTSELDNRMEMDPVISVDGKGGFYLAVRIKIDASAGNNHGLFYVKSAVANRYSIIALLGGLRPTVDIDTDNAGGSVRAVRTSGQVTKGVWINIELMVRLNNDVACWVNGVEQALFSDEPTTDTEFNVGEPSFIQLVNEADADIADVIFYNGAITDEARTSISDYLNGDDL